jgi:hypothetical protein
MHPSDHAADREPSSQAFSSFGWNVEFGLCSACTSNCQIPETRDTTWLPSMQPCMHGRLKCRKLDRQNWQKSLENDQ